MIDNVIYLVEHWCPDGIISEATESYKKFDDAYNEVMQLSYDESSWTQITKLTVYSDGTELREIVW